jgi:uncharacterized protein YggL (DUF469 family)
MDKSLELVFKNQAGKNTRISVKDPKEDLTTQEVEALMNSIIEKNVFETTGGDLVEIVGARLIQKEVVDLIIS